MFRFQNPNISGKEPEIYDARKAPLALYGLYKPEVKGVFRRLPEDVAEATSPNVKRLSVHTSGARLRFRTDSDYIALGAVYPEEGLAVWGSGVLCPNGCFRFDLYADGKFCNTLCPAEDTVEHVGQDTIYRVKNGQYEASYTFGDKRMREITIHFPYAAYMTDVFVGVSKGSLVEEPAPYRNELPVVYYGSSITQGCFVSRSGNIYQNVLSRKWNIDYLNLGFGGAALAEDAIIDYICGLEMSVFVYDYDHNAPDPEYLAATHYKGLEKVRKAHPDIPIILMTRPNQCGGMEQVKQRMAIVEESYRKRLQLGDKNIYYISGQDMFYALDSEMSTIDGTHPNDLGAYCMAEAIDKVMSIWW